MTIDWLMFLPALFLLLTPGDLFNGGKVRYRDVTRDWHDYWLRALAHGLHTIDLGRAALGTWLLLSSIEGIPDSHGLMKYAPLLLQGSIRLVAVLTQTVVCRERDAANAPFAFVIGLLLAGTSPEVNVLAVVLAATLALGSRTPVAFFPVVALAHLGIGFWFEGKRAVLGLAVGSVAAVMPFLWAMMFHRDLVVAYRAKRQTVENQLPPPR